MKAVPWKALAQLRQRRTWVLVHRWVGLLMAGFLVIAGLTGSVLAWYEPLYRTVSPELFHAPAPYPGAVPLDPLTLHEHAQAAVGPDVEVGYALLHIAPGEVPKFHVQGAEDPRTGQHIDPGFNEIYLDPYTGAEILRTRWGDPSEGRHNLLPFIYRLHASLALGEIGVVLFGIIALLWTLDCFVGACLTLPKARPLLQKWQPAWRLKPARLNYDLHRAGGLWTWLLLLVFAWSSVALNLHEVYEPVTRTLLGMKAEEDRADAVHAAEPSTEVMSLREAHRIGRQLMAAQLPLTGETFAQEDSLAYDHHRNEFVYWVAVQPTAGNRTDPWVGVMFDAHSGRLNHVDRPQPDQAGDIVTYWLIALHRASVGGWPYRVVVFVVGIVVAMLSVTGMVIWWRKRRVHASPRRAQLGMPTLPHSDFVKPPAATAAAGERSP